MLRLQISLAVLTAIAACRTDGPGPGSDAGGDGDGDGDGDAAIVGSNLAVELEASPDPPDSFSGVFTPTMDAVSIAISDYRAVGDAASNDNNRIANLVLTWAEDDDESASFRDIPVGRYTRVLGQVDNFFLSGTCVVNAQTFNWEIEDTPPGGIDFTSDFDEVFLAPGEITEVELDVGLARIFDEVDWATITPVGNLLRVDASSSEIDSVRDSVREAFEEDVED